METKMHLYLGNSANDYFVAESLEEAREEAADQAEYDDEQLSGITQVPDEEELELRLYEKGDTFDIETEEGIPTIKTAQEWAQYLYNGDLGAGGTGKGFFFCKEG